MNWFNGYAAIFLCAYGLTFSIRRYAYMHWMDNPNHRSAHTIPTPRGGGLSFALTFVLTIAIFWHYELVTTRLAIGIGMFSAIITVVGLMDDVYSLSPITRLCAECLVTIGTIYYLYAPMPVWGMAIAVFYVLWMLNLYNFMDGIDGLAATEAICVSFGGAILYYLDADHIENTYVLIALGFATLGFLIWNFPKARIFMGDSGSYFLGFVLAVLSLEAGHIHPKFLYGFMILLGAFIVDATFTLLLRLVAKENVFQAHQSHAYQKAAQKYKAHWPVTMGILCINVLWLLPIAMATQLELVPGPLGLVFAYFPLIGLAHYFKSL